jgi:pimeloyl-ACP methyl ester carboxylesterase
MSHIGLVDIGSAKLYAEVSGSGPALLCIAGASGDAGEWSAVAALLAPDFTVVTYDRRGMSRSPRPDGYTAVSLAEQADDAAALLRTLNLTAALVVGHSGGASIACELVAHHPAAVRHAVVYEPPLFAAIPGGDEIVAGLRAAVEPVYAEHGHRAAMEAFLRANVSQEVADTVLGSMNREDLDRVLDNGAVFIPIELPVFASYLPDVDRMRASGVPMTVVTGVDSADGWAGAVARWLTGRTGATAVNLSGGHVGFYSNPEELVALIRDIADAG